GGIGLIIYLVIYYGKDPIRCVHCNSICSPKLVEKEVSSNYQTNNPTYEAGTALVIEKEQKADVIRSKYCFNCGAQLDQRSGLKFCPFCGSMIE
ncbi:MAG: hypothetical protein ACFFC9_10815, partial [Promethearchaeota archaeon]